MRNLSFPIEVVLTISAIGWPLLAGLGIVFWSKARAASHRPPAVKAVAGYGRPDRPDVLEVPIQGLDGAAPEVMALRAGSPPIRPRPEALTGTVSKPHA